MKRKKNCMNVLKHFGTTDDPYCIGYIYPDGKKIDFCNRLKQKMPHAQIGEVVHYDHPISEFLEECGSIRISKPRDDTVLRVHSRKKPNDKQIEKIVELLEGVEYFYGAKYPISGALDFECEYTKKGNVRGLDVRRWINKCGGEQ